MTYFHFIGRVLDQVFQEVGLVGGGGDGRLGEGGVRGGGGGLRFGVDGGG